MNQKSNLLVQLIDYYDGIVHLADALGITMSAISQWRTIPKHRAYQIEVLTKGKFKAKAILKEIKNER